MGRVKPLASRTARLLGSKIKVGALNLCGSPTENPFLGRTCNHHKDFNKRCSCGLAPWRYFKITRRLPDVEEFILRLDQLPMELLQIITTFLVPKLEKGQKFWLYDDGRMQCRGQQYSAAYRNMLYEGGKIHSRGQECAAAYQNIHFCFIQGFVEVFHRMIEGKHKNPRVNRVAEKLLAEFLNYVGSNTVVQLKCYESEDHRRPFGSLKLSRTWLGDLFPLSAHIQHVTLDLAVTECLPSLHHRESVQLCNNIVSTFPKLGKVVLYLHLRRHEIDKGIKASNKQGWVLACRKLELGAGGVKNFKIFLTEIKGNPQHHHGWYRKGEYTSKRFFEQRKKRGQDYQYWVDNVKRDEQLLRRTLGAKGRMMAAEMKEEMSVEDKE